MFKNADCSYECVAVISPERQIAEISDPEHKTENTDKQKKYKGKYIGFFTEVLFDFHFSNCFYFFNLIKKQI